ncbi:nitrate/nitrite transporter NarK [Streptomyces sp. PsTaAH-137]|nr:nitrate/nitrite transporter NarK [Streptomyces sp. PsTaAH-137]
MNQARTDKLRIRQLPPYLRMLTATQLAFNIGFYAVLPYLATHLTGTLGLAGWAAGLVLGLRTFSQQGLFVVGGALTDRYGPRPVVLTGCALRIAGFLWLGFADSTATVVAAVLLVGFAAALFSPAVESETAREAVRHEAATGIPRAQVLGVFSAAGQAGAFLGPLLGTALLFAGFRAACVAGALVFVGVLAGHARFMPRRARVPARGLTGAAAVLARPRFLALCLAYSGYLIAYNQLYLALPAEAVRTTGSQDAVGPLFALSSLLVVFVQLPVTRWSAGRLAPRTALTAGLLLVAAGFATVAATAGRLPGPGYELLPLGVLVVLLTCGQMLLVPAARGLVPDLVDARHLGLATGALSSVAGLAVLGGSAATGALLTLPAPVLWSALAAVPLASAGLARWVTPGRNTGPARCVAAGSGTRSQSYEKE